MQAPELTDQERIELADAALSDTCGDFHETRGFVQDVAERIVRQRVAEALAAASSDPSLRLSGHSGISISRLRLLAFQMEGI